MFSCLFVTCHSIQITTIQLAVVKPRFWTVIKLGSGVVKNASFWLENVRHTMGFKVRRGGEIGSTWGNVCSCRGIGGVVLGGMLA